MQNAAQAYGRVAKETALPRDLEAQLLLKAAWQLQAVQDDWEARRADLEPALLYNRKLWTVFVSSVTREENPLPASIRQNVANLGLFVMKQTISLIAEPQPEKLNSLISINRELAAGLLARS